MPAQEDQPTGSQIVTSVSTNFTWEITNFTQLTGTAYYSRPFTVGIYSWRVLVYPKGDKDSPGHLSLFLAVTDSQNLPEGWAADVDYSFTVVNQSTPNSSIRIRRRNRNFCASLWCWGYPKMITLEKMHDDGFLVNNTLIIEVGLVVKERHLDTFESYFSSLEQYISRVNDVPVCCLASPLDARSPTLEEVEDAKQSLKECLSDLFKLNMKDRLAEALSTLSRAEVGLSASQKSSVQVFLDRFEEFTSDFLGFEQDNSEFELQKLLKDQMFSAMKKCHEMYMTLKTLSKQIAEEEEECGRKMEEISKMKERLETSWELLVAKTQVVKTKHAEHEKKAKDAEEKKRIAEERMSRSTAAWSSLKSEFILSPDTSPAKRRKVMKGN